MAGRKHVWIEKLLTRNEDGTLGMAKTINTLEDNGVRVLNYRVIRTGENSWLLLMEICEDAKSSR